MRRSRAVFVHHDGNQVGETVEIDIATSERDGYGRWCRCVKEQERIGAIWKQRCDIYHGMTLIWSVE